jgi:hypothetical protein
MAIIKKGVDENGVPYHQTTSVHLNGQLLAAIDVKTTGQDSTIHEIYELAIIPVDSFIFRRKDKYPLDLLIKPDYPDKVDWKFLEKQNCGTQIRRAIEKGHPKHVARSLFDRWLEDLRMLERLRIAPIAYNYGHESRFLRAWLGHNTYQTIFNDLELRDVRSIAGFLNDMADMRQAPYPFHKLQFAGLGRHLGIFRDYGKGRSALHDAAQTIDIYREMMKITRKEMI